MSLIILEETKYDVSDENGNICRVDDPIEFFWESLIKNPSDTNGQYQSLFSRKRGNKEREQVKELIRDGIPFIVKIGTTDTITVTNQYVQLESDITKKQLHIRNVTRLFFVIHFVNPKHEIYYKLKWS